MQAKTKWMAAGGVALLAALLAWAFAPRPTLVELGEAKTGHFESGIEEDGKTRVIARYQVSAPLAGRWLRPALEEGDAVKAGDVIGRIEPTLAPLLDARSQAELGAREQAAQAAQPRAAARQAAAEIAVAQAQKNLERAEALAKQGFVAASNRDDARLALQAAQQELRSAQAEVQIARHELQQARAALGAFGASQGSGTARPFDLRAPVAGQVLRVQQPSEAMVGLGTPLLELGDVGQLEVVAELLSTDALMLKPGQPVRIERWGGPGVLQGQVERVEPGAFTKVSALGVEEQRVKVQIALASPPEQRRGLGDGYRVVVRVLTRQQDGALLVPVSAVFPMPGAEPGRHAVFRADGGHARLSEVQVEARNSSVAWIAKGLDAGAKVIVYPPQGLADGARIKPR